jgi:hypothetical protein
MQSAERLRGRLLSGAVVEVMRTRDGRAWRYRIVDGEPLVPDPDDRDGTLFRTIIHRRAVRLVQGPAAER